jgi:hypothetical protein
VREERKEIQCGLVHDKVFNLMVILHGSWWGTYLMPHPRIHLELYFIIYVKLSKTNYNLGSNKTNW